eukprot:5893608-Pleurochrysis_carterae.AAC.2
MIKKNSMSCLYVISSSLRKLAYAVASHAGTATAKARRASVVGFYLLKQRPPLPPRPQYA